MIKKLESENKLKSEDHLQKLKANLELFIEDIYKKIKNGKKAKKYEEYDAIWIP